jgi:hypothetical protein
MTEDKIIVTHEVELGFDVEEEVEKVLKKEIDPDIIEDTSEILEAISERPGNKKATEKIKLEKTMEEVVNYIEEEGQIVKDKMNEMMGLNTISSVGKLRNFIKKNYQKKFVKKGKDAYVIEG